MASTHPKDTAPEPPWCPVEEALTLLTGKWRMLVLFRLASGPMRFNALQRALGPVTQKVLTATLRGLENDGLVWRQSEGTVPPSVSYGLTEKGAALGPVFDALAQWRLAPQGTSTLRNDQGSASSSSSGNSPGRPSSGVQSV